MTATLILGDCIERMKELPANSIDATTIALNSLCVIHEDMMKDYTCPVCKKNFTKYSYKAAQAIYCCQSCAYKGRTLGFTKRVISKPYVIKHSLKNRIKKNCEICNKEFEAIPSKDKKHKYCCRLCFEISHKKRMLGKGNPAYINGSSYNKRSYRGDDWEDVRKEIYKRDGWLCQVCFKHCAGQEIQCHHIVPYKISKDNTPSNLITLCNRCHNAVEFGKKEVRSCG